MDEGLGKPKSTFFYFFYFLCVSARIQWVVKNEKRKNPKESAALTTRGTTEEKEMERSRSSRVQCRAAIAAAAAAHLFKYYTTPVHHQHQSGRKGVRVYQRNGQNIYRLERTTTREAKGAGGGGTDNTTYFFSLFSSTTTYTDGVFRVD